MGEIRRIYEQHYWETWLKIQRERQKELEQREAKLDIEQTYLKAKQKQREIEERYGIKPEQRSKEFEAQHPRNKNGTFAVKTDGQDLTKNEKQVIIDNKDDIINAFANSGFNGTIHIPPQNLDIDALKYDNKHITERQHNVSEKQAKRYIQDALISFSKTVGNTEYENYIGRNGAAYVGKADMIIRTAFPSSQYNAGTKRILDTLDNVINSKGDKK